MDQLWNVKCTGKFTVNAQVVAASKELAIELARSQTAEHAYNFLNGGLAKKFNPKDVAAKPTLTDVRNKLAGCAWTATLQEPGIVKLDWDISR